MRVDDDLRQAQCTNKQSRQLLEVLKADLECGWDSGAHGEASVRLLAIALVVVAASTAMRRH